MHDAKGRPLKEGDVILIPCRVKTLSATEDYCNVWAKSLIGRRPDGSKESFGSLNTGVTLRANADDQNDIGEYR